MRSTGIALISREWECATLYSIFYINFKKKVNSTPESEKNVIYLYMLRFFPIMELNLLFFKLKVPLMSNVPLLVQHMLILMNEVV